MVNKIRALNQLSHIIKLEGNYRLNSKKTCKNGQILISG